MYINYIIILAMLQLYSENQLRRNLSKTPTYKPRLFLVVNMSVFELSSIEVNRLFNVPVIDLFLHAGHVSQRFVQVFEERSCD